MTHALVAAFTALSVVAQAQPASAPAPAPAPAPAAEAPAPAPATWDEVTSTTTVTTTTTTTSDPAAVPPPTVAPAPAPAPAPPPRPRDPVANALIGTGAGLLGLGAISLVFVAAPAALVKRVALRRADDEDSLAFSSRETRYQRARNADDTMEAAFWVGISALVVGVVVLTTGAVLKNRPDRPARTARTARAERIGRRASVRLDGGAGGLRLRF